MRVDFVANASHELRKPLSAILGFIETLSDPNAGGDPETRDRFLKIMFDEAQRMQRLVEDLLSLSRIEAEKYQLPATSVDLGRSEEHTSELQSLMRISYAVFCLKKKTRQKQNQLTQITRIYRIQKST